MEFSKTISNNNIAEIELWMRSRRELGNEAVLVVNLQNHESNGVCILEKDITLTAPKKTGRNLCF